MNVTVLVENTTGNPLCNVEHGLSFYIETAAHRLLFDTGASSLLAENAAALQIDLSNVDTVVLSHGHYDHGGGLPYLLDRAESARFFIPKEAFGSYWSIHKDGPHYIGLDQTLKDNRKLTVISGYARIDETLELFSEIRAEAPVPFANRRLMIKTGNSFQPDPFTHEQCLVIRENNALYLFSGCAHHGIDNILTRFHELYGCDPAAVFGGFHMMKRSAYTIDEEAQIIHTAKTLSACDTVFYTCHCTGEAAYDLMKPILREKLQYLHCGNIVKLKQ